MKRPITWLILLTVVFLQFPNSSHFVTANATNEKLLELPEEISESLEESVNEETYDDLYQPNDIVRIIVELEEEPAISYATEQGVLFKELNEQVQEELQQELLDQQEIVMASIQNTGVQFDVEHQFTTVVNGFSTEVTYKEYDLIKTINGVENVYISNEYQLPEEQQPDMNYSIDIIKAAQVWQDYGYTGEGMIIGVIDSGIDPNHPDMALSEDAVFTLSEEKIQQLQTEHQLDGVYFSNKIPYGYNYMDKNTQIVEQGPSISSHGMHVAGTVAANGEITGVAPDAQLLALRVFGDDPLFQSTYGDIYVKAIDDAIILGADAVNLSLGSVAGFVRPTDPEQEAIRRVVDNGIIASISAGNSAHFSSAITSNHPLAANPDIGLTGSPSVSADSIGIASLENTFIEMEGFEWRSDSGQGSAAFLASNDYHKSITEPIEIIHIEHGNDLSTLETRLAEADVDGKFVLLQRGLNFIDKALAVQQAGGSGVIVYNHSAGYISMATDNRITIPQLFISRTDGLNFVQLLENDELVELTFAGDPVIEANPEAGALSSFTSWGLTPNLDFKPELTAPGGNILSTIQGDSYGLKSGTSMAAPHVAGGAALILEKIDQDFQLEGYERAIFAKNLLLNTSTIVDDKSLYNNHYQLGNPYSPRRQGAGIMDLHAALETPVIVTEPSTGEAKVSLQEVDDSFSFTLQATNFSDNDVSYALNGNVQTDLIVSGRNLVEAQGIFKAGTIASTAPWLGEYPITFSTNELNIPAGETVEFTVTVDLANTIDWFYEQPLATHSPNGSFIEGFITLSNEAFPTLSIPYVGFYGQWDQAPILDQKRYEDGAFLPHTGLVDEAGYYLAPLNDLEELHGETNILAFSPNADGQIDQIVPVLSFLRNAKQVQYNILSEDGASLRTIKRENDVRKTYDTPGYTYRSDRAWDGTANRRFVADGLYYYEVKTVIDFDSAEWQSFTFPVLVDTTAPEISLAYNPQDSSIDWTVVDHGSGLAEISIYANGEEIDQIDLSTNRIEQTGIIDVSDLPADSTVEVRAHDRAANGAKETVNEVNSESVPYIYITGPGVLSAHDSHTIQVKGYVESHFELDTLTVNEQVISFTYNEEGDQYNFDTETSFDQDGAPDIFFEATDVRGNSNAIKRQVLIDTTPPTLAIDIPESIAHDATEVTLTVTVADNFNALSLYVNDSHEYEKSLQAPYGESDFEDHLELTVQLEDGDTDLYFELVDVAGNTVEEELTLSRDDPPKVEAPTFSLGLILKRIFTSIWRFFRP
ncbi:lactocepin [Amphibacillus marinus]|uniref:Lactocepin n=1 Tax=Amphibacillus marinus TaxID=872970 RepID=A0A1H8IL84_9BACI|nr:S8 family serine peptidase [Amphibacillus marinus]SEN68697.1 lactocepin [Amphibacillus marinus]